MSSDKPLPFIKLFPLDFLARTQHLSTAEFGTLVRVILASWSTRPLLGERAATIPEDPAFVRMVARPTSLPREIRGVREHFKPDPEDPGTLLCSWLREMYDDAAESHGKHSAAGRRGGRPPKGERPPRRPHPTDPHPPTSPTNGAGDFTHSAGNSLTTVMGSEGRAENAREALREKPGESPGKARLSQGFPGAFVELKPGISPEEASGKQSELELETEQQPAAAARVRVREPDEPERKLLAALASPYRDAVARLLDAAPLPRRGPLAAAILGWLQGQGFAGGARAAPEDLAVGAGDYLGGSDDLSFRSGHVRRWVEQAWRVRLARTATPSDEGGGHVPAANATTARADALYDIVLQHHLGTVNQLQAEMALEQARTSGGLDATTLAELPLLQPWRDLAYAPPAMGRKLARDRYLAKRPRPALQVIA